MTVQTGIVELLFLIVAIPVFTTVSMRKEIFMRLLEAVAMLFAKVLLLEIVLSRSPPYRIQSGFTKHFLIS